MSSTSLSRPTRPVEPTDPRPAPGTRPVPPRRAVRHRLRDLVLVTLGAALGATALGVATSLAEEVGPDVAVPDVTATRVLDDPLLSHLEAVPIDRATVVAVDRVAPEPRSVWDDLADCESGNWDRGGHPIEGSARWDYGLRFDHGDFFEGGLNFHPRTWDAFRDEVHPEHAGHATRAEQILVAERVLDAQGWGAWPTCSRKLGLR